MFIELKLLFCLIDSCYIGKMSLCSSELQSNLCCCDLNKPYKATIFCRSVKCIIVEKITLKFSVRKPDYFCWCNICRF